MKDEAALLRAARKFDQDALAATFNLYAPAIYKYGLRVFGDPIAADNLVGDVFEQLLEKLATGQGPLTNLRSYLYKIAYHLVTTGVRPNKRFAHLGAVVPPAGELPSALAQMTFEERDLMEALISSLNNELSADQRHVIVLRFLEDFSLGETATIMGKTVNNVKVIQNRAIAKLRKSLGALSEMGREGFTPEAGPLADRPSGTDGARQDGVDESLPSWPMFPDPGQSD